MSNAPIFNITGSRVTYIAGDQKNYNYGGGTGKPNREKSPPITPPETPQPQTQVEEEGSVDSGTESPEKSPNPSQPSNTHPQNASTQHIQMDAPSATPTNPSPVTAPSHAPRPVSKGGAFPLTPPPSRPSQTGSSSVLSTPHVSPVANPAHEAYSTSQSTSPTSPLGQSRGPFSPQLPSGHQGPNGYWTNNPTNPTWTGDNIPLGDQSYGGGSMMQSPPYPQTPHPYPQAQQPYPQAQQPYLQTQQNQYHNPMQHSRSPARLQTSIAHHPQSPPYSPYLQPSYHQGGIPQRDPNYYPHQDQMNGRPWPNPQDPNQHFNHPPIQNPQNYNRPVMSPSPSTQSASDYDRRNDGYFMPR